MERPRIRLYVEAPLTDGGTVALDGKQAHYLFTVMRLGLGGAVALFNGRDGEWRAEVESAGKNKGLLRLVGQSVPQGTEPDLWLVFAPIKRAHIDFLAEKATELGVSRLVPIITQYTDVARVNTGRLRANAVEAAEQTERLSIPEVDEPQPLDALLGAWPADRVLIALDESGGGRPILEALLGLAQGDGLAAAPCAILVGPEGGFAAHEMQKLRALPFVTTVGLGPRILRSDTAALAALTCWQAAGGDWHLPPSWSDRRTAGGKK
jgi:16S rRNA (uracil1498-N3)-methyltransferase